MEKSAFEALGGSYMEVNGTLIPDLVIQESEPIGKYGRMKTFTWEMCIPASAASSAAASMPEHCTKSLRPMMR